MRNLFVMNHIEHIESEKSVDFTVYNQNRIFVAFVRVFHDENTISNETYFEQWIRIDRVLTKIEDIIIDKKDANHSIMNLTNHEFDEHTICSMNMQQVWRTCDMSNKFAMNHEHAIDSQSSKKSLLNFIFTSHWKMINSIENLFEQYSKNDFIKFLISFIFNAKVIHKKVHEFDEKTINLKSSWNFHMIATCNMQQTSHSEDFWQNARFFSNCVNVKAKNFVVFFNECANATTWIAT